MTTALVFISLVLNILALLTIVVLYQRQNKFFDIEKKQQAMMKEMEDLISTYLAEMKEENEQFILSVSKVKEQKKQMERLSQETVDNIQLPPLPKYKGSIPNAVKAYGAKPVDGNETSQINHDPVTMHSEDEEPTLVLKPEPKPLSLEDRAFLLKKQGHTLEEIAKLLERGQTEIELLLKFRQEPEE